MMTYLGIKAQPDYSLEGVGISAKASLTVPPYVGCLDYAGCVHYGPFSSHLEFFLVNLFVTKTGWQSMPIFFGCLGFP
jgi:hypothetical protein